MKSKLSNQITKSIYFFDTYAISFQVQFRYRATFQTNYGGLITTILLILGLAIIILLYIFLEKRDEQKIVTFSQRHSDPPEFFMSSNYSNITYSTVNSNYGFFFYSIYFLNINTNRALTLDEISQKFNYLALDVILKNGVKSSEVERELILCSELYPDIESRFNNHRLGESYCIKEDPIAVKGDFISETYHYTLLRLFKKNANNITSFLKTLKVVIYRSDYTLDNQIKKDSPITYIIKPIEVILDNSISYEADIYVSFNQFKSNDNLYTPWNTQKIQTCYKIDKICSRYIPQNDKFRLMNLYLRSSYQYESYHREFKSFFDMLCQLGGLSKVLIFIGTILVVPINLILMNVTISNKMFNMVHPDNEAEVQMTYEQYIAKEEMYDLVPEIFQSLNQVLKRISIDYYRYERNKGMDFTLREALGKMCCCCCKIKSIISKDLIFKSSEAEIEKRLDIRTVVHYAQTVNATKRVLFNNYTGILDSFNWKLIDETLLGQIKDEYNQQYAFSIASPLSIVNHKQDHLVSAFNTMRNQGDLTKIDLLMIKLFNLDPKLVMKFFMTYSDRFYSIYPEMFKHKESKNKNKDKDSIKQMIKRQEKNEVFIDDSEQRSNNKLELFSNRTNLFLP